MSEHQETRIISSKYPNRLHRDGQSYRQESPIFYFRRGKRTSYLILNNYRFWFYSFFKISNLSEKFNKIKIGADELPKLVDRMDSLQNVHEESAELVISANNLQAVQNYILSSVNENKEILLIFKKEFDTNMKTMENNLALLSKRIENLTKK